MMKRLQHPLFRKNEHVQNRTVRFAFHIAFIAFVLGGMAAALTEQTSYISIETDPVSVKNGETFTITVKAVAHTPVNAVDITLSYPESQIVIDSIDKGVSVITLWAEEPYARDGSIHLTGGVFQRGFVGEHTIARIRAHAIESGFAHVSAEDITLVAGDGKGSNVSVTDAGKNETRIYVADADGTLEGAVSVSIITDIDGDGKVTLADVSSFMSAWFTRNKLFDFNNDGKMTFNDFSILLADSFFK